MRVLVEVEEVTLNHPDGLEVEGICVSCTECGHEVEVFGTSERSVKRGCVMLREECPNSDENFYVYDE